MKTFLSEQDKQWVETLEKEGRWRDLYNYMYGLNTALYNEIEDLKKKGKENAEKAWMYDNLNR